MGSILRSILPIRSSKQDEDDDEFNPEYSFAMEYTGPPVSYDIPRAVPVDVAYIPTASVVSTPFTSGNLSLPVIHPVIKREPKSISSEIKDTSLVSGLIVPDTPPEGEGSSASLGFSDSQENSQEFSMSSEGDGLDNYCHEIVELCNSSQQDENQNESHEEISSYDNRTQFVGINYKDCTDFWVGPDGSVLEEGQKQVKGNMWEKPGIKMVCSILSLPMPPKSFMSSEDETVNNGSKIMQKNIDIKPLTKILLVGQDQSGTSAIYKQAKTLYKIPFLENEREELKSLIQRNLYLYISILLEGLIKFEEEYSIQIRNKLVDQPGTSAAGGSIENIYSLSTKLKNFSDWLLEIVKSGNLGTVFPAATREYSGVVEELWKDKAFQAAYARRSELGAFPIVADYFLPRAVEISSTNYEPSDVDILYADGISSSNGLTSMEFSVPSSFTNSYMEVTEHNNPPLQRYELIRVNSSNLGDNCKWLSMFEDVDLILYCVDLTSYDEFYIDNNLMLKNKMLESKNLFKTMVTHPRFKDKAFLLILNKFDLLENKIKTRPLTECEWFHDFNPFISNHTNNNNNNNSNNNNDSCVAQYGFQYVAAKFKRLFGELTGRKLYVTPVTGLEGDSVDAALRYGGEVLRWVDEENKPKSSNNEWSSESVETSS
ncbi:unnamed protein product [Lactuca virosa]|uniref:Uncharacterized protein n=1 Tax=Lactuca virosa TaxID=75947 RepID=A0AAU9NBM4_9ASTR|nr:unnamed protein product [Lactuca virosa]